MIFAFTFDINRMFLNFVSSKSVILRNNSDDEKILILQLFFFEKLVKVLEQLVDFRYPYFALTQFDSNTASKKFVILL